MINFEKFTLENGLKVIVHKDKSTPIVAFNLLYDVGARDENENQTGFAHLFEHLMFNGTENYNSEYFEPFEKIKTHFLFFSVLKSFLSSLFPIMPSQ